VPPFIATVPPVRVSAIGTPADRSFDRRDRCDGRKTHHHAGRHVSGTLFFGPRRYKGVQGACNNGGLRLGTAPLFRRPGATRTAEPRARLAKPIAGAGVIARSRASSPSAQTRAAERLGAAPLVEGMATVTLPLPRRKRTPLRERPRRWSERQRPFARKSGPGRGRPLATPDGWTLCRFAAATEQSQALIKIGRIEWAGRDQEVQKGGEDAVKKRRVCCL